MSFIDDLLDKSKTCANIDSDYRLAKVIGITHSAMTHYRMGRSLPNESVIEQLCALSGDDPDVIAAQIQAERSKDPEAKTLWLRVAARMAGGASTAILSVLIAIVLIAGFAPPAWAKNDADRYSLQSKFLYIVSITILSVPHLLMVRLRRFARLFLPLAYW